MPFPKRSAAEAETIYKVETVPPPDGDDAYSATTKVGALSTAQVAALMRGSDEAAAPESGAPESGLQMRARSVSVGDLVPIDVDTAAFAEVHSPEAPACAASFALTPPRAPALLPPALMLAALPMVEACPASTPPTPTPTPPTPQRAVRSRIAFLAVIAVAWLALFVAAGVWMFVHVVAKP